MNASSSDRFKKITACLLRLLGSKTIYWFTCINMLPHDYWYHSMQIVLLVLLFPMLYICMWECQKPGRMASNATPTQQRCSPQYTAKSAAQLSATSLFTQAVTACHDCPVWVLCTMFVWARLMRGTKDKESSWVEPGTRGKRGAVAPETWHALTVFSFIVLLFHLIMLLPCW